MSDRTPRPTIEGDRTVSPAAGRGWWTTRRASTIGGLSLFALCAFVLWKMPGQKPDKNALPEKPTLAVATQNPYRPPPAEPETQIQKAVVQVQTVQPAVQPEIKQAIGQGHNTDSSSSAPLFYSYSVPPLPDQFKPKDKATAGAEGEAPNTTAIAYKGTQLPGIKAGSIGNQTLMLPPGVIVCTMSTVIESTVEGQFICTINSDVKSPRGVTLIDGGSYVQGSYDVKVQTGQRRLRASTLAIWNLKANCVVPLNGPMSDALGRAGLDGDYDPHTWEKLGAAGAVMLTESLFGLAQAALQSGNGNSYFQLNTGSMSSLANELLRMNASIPPTITIHQGSQVGFWIPTAVNFKDCYGLTVTGR